MLKYKELQIIKHSLQYYVNRPGASNKDVKEEKRLHEKVNNKVEKMKELYEIQ